MRAVLTQRQSRWRQWWWSTSRRPASANHSTWSGSPSWPSPCWCWPGWDRSRATRDAGSAKTLPGLVRATPIVFLRVFSVLGGVGAWRVPLGLMVVEIARGHSRRLIEALITGLAAIGLIEGLDRVLASFPSSALNGR